MHHSAPVKLRTPGLGECGSSSISLHFNPNLSADLCRRPHWYNVNVQANYDCGIAETLALTAGKVTRHRDGLEHDPTCRNTGIPRLTKSSTLPSKFCTMHGNKVLKVLYQREDYRSADNTANMRVGWTMGDDRPGFNLTSLDNHLLS